MKGRYYDLQYKLDKNYDDWKEYSKKDNNMLNKING